MTTVIIVIHLMVVLAMIGLILLQRSEGGALGIGGGSGAFLTGRSAGNVLSHTTAYLAIAFFVTSLGLAFLGKYQSRPSDILERLPGQSAPLTDTPAPPTPAGAPTSAQDLLNQLGGGSTGGPQTPPAAEGAPAPSTAPAAEAPAIAPTEAPAPAPIAAPAPAAQDAAPAKAPAPATAPAPAPQTLPSTGQ